MKRVDEKTIEGILKEYQSEEELFFPEETELDERQEQFIKGYLRAQQKNKGTFETEEEVRQQINFMEAHRRTLQFGRFYRLKSPFEGNVTAWMSVNRDQSEAVVGWYRVLNDVNAPFTRIRLQGLDPDRCYQINDSESFYGDELMYAGLITSDSATADGDPKKACCGDFDSRIFILKA